MPPAARRIPIKLHRNVALIRASDPLLVEEILARKTIARLVVGRLSEAAILVRAEDEETLIDELKKLGQSPRIVR